MGQPKALLPWLGTTLISYQVEQLIQAGVRPLVVVLGAEARRIAVPLRHFPEAILVSNPLYNQGKTTSIQAGIRGLPGPVDALLIHAVDQPRRAATLRRLIDAHLEGKALITLPVHQGRRGHPLLLAARLLPLLSALTEEQQGLREIVHRYKSATLELPMDTPELLLDLNTPEDYREALAHLEELQP